MLSIGIRFGLGFDFFHSARTMQKNAEEFTYDLAVLGTDPGGLALARQASAAGKRVLVIKWKNFSPAELEGKDEDLEEMAFALDMKSDKSPSFLQQAEMQRSSDPLMVELSKMVDRDKDLPQQDQQIATKMIQSDRTKYATSRKARRFRKVRVSRLDLNNEFFKRGQEGRKMMRNSSLYNDKVAEAGVVGWRVPQIHTPLTINWNKMSENVMDYVMKENWKLASILSGEQVEVIEGRPLFIDQYTVKLNDSDADDTYITAEFFCVAPSCENYFPMKIKGAVEFGITPDDFIRLDYPPLKTLVVGSTPEGLECAGIVAACGYPVTVMTKSRVLNGMDNEMARVVVNDLKKRGVVFLEQTTLVKVELSHDDDRLLTKFDTNESIMKIHGEHDRQDDFMMPDVRKKKKVKEEVFDTVVFAVGRRVRKEFLELEAAGIQVDSNGDIHTDEHDRTSVPHIYALGTIASFKPKGYDISEVAGTLLGRRLFFNETELMDYSLYPTVIYTPVEYAFFGISEEAAFSRLGMNCVDVYTGNFKPLEYIIPPKQLECFIKLIVHKPKGTVIGVHIVGPEAGEIIQGFLCAVKRGLTIQDVHNTVGVPVTKAREIFKLKTPKKVDVLHLNAE